MGPNSIKFRAYLQFCRILDTLNISRLADIWLSGMISPPAGIVDHY